MSYIETPVDFPYPWYLRVIFRRQRRRYGRELEPVRLWARMPAAFLAMSAMHRALDRKISPIEPALRYAEAATRSDIHVDAALVARLRAHFNDQAIVELAALIAFQNMSSKFNAALGVPAHGFCALPHSTPQSPPGAR